jgi:hypothetical protein
MTPYIGAGIFYYAAVLMAIGCYKHRADRTLWFIWLVFAVAFAVFGTIMTVVATFGPT